MIDWVENNISETPTLEAMAEHVGYSCFYCSAKFHEAVGISFQEYILKRKLTLAAEELVKTDARVIDIAIKYGFSSHEAFSRVFLKKVGYNPSLFRKEKPAILLCKKAELI
jgi:AraC-like DNA-binding protein